RRFRRILDSESSADLIELLSEPGPSFKARLVSQIFRSSAKSRKPGKGRIYLNIGHTGLDNGGFRASLQEADVRPISVAHDLIPTTNLDCGRAGENDRHRARMDTILTTAARVIGNSQATLDSMASYARKMGLPQPPAGAAWLGTTSLAGTEAPAAVRS